MSETIAYHIGVLCNVDALRCYIGIEGDGRVGVLVEFFYGHPRAPHEDRFVHGSDLIQRFLVDKKAERPNGARTNVAVCKAYGIANAAEFWGKVLAFDALIGNTDRHPDSWGII